MSIRNYHQYKMNDRYSPASSDGFMNSPMKMLVTPNKNRMRNSEHSSYDGPSTSAGFNSNSVNSNTYQSYGNSSSTPSKFQFQRNYKNDETGRIPPKHQPYTNNATTSKQNQLGLMTLPRNKYIQPSSDAMNSNVSQHDRDNVKGMKLGDSEDEKLRVLSGTVERVIKYGKMFQNHLCYFQVFGSVVSIADGKVQFEKKMILRDKKGPVLHVTYYINATYIKIENFYLGQNLRALGRMIEPNIMSAINIRAATDAEMDALPRFCYISDYAVSVLCGDKQI